MREIQEELSAPGAPVESLTCKKAECSVSLAAAPYEIQLMNKYRAISLLRRRIETKYRRPRRRNPEENRSISSAPYTCPIPVTANNYLAVNSL